MKLTNQRDTNIQLRVLHLNILQVLSKRVMYNFLNKSNFLLLNKHSVNSNDIY